jgi:hypothetical protein
MGIEARRFQMQMINPSQIVVQPAIHHAQVQEEAPLRLKRSSPPTIINHVLSNTGPASAFWASSAMPSLHLLQRTRLGMLMCAGRGAELCSISDAAPLDDAADGDLLAPADDAAHHRRPIRHAQVQEEARERDPREREREREKKKKKRRRRRNFAAAGPLSLIARKRLYSFITKRDAAVTAQHSDSTKDLFCI